ncbi:MAG: tetratricopeptide repeat protein [bacterium]
MSRGPSLSGPVVAVLGVLLALPLVELAVRVTGLAPDLRFIDVTNDESTVYRRSENPILGFELKPDWRDDHADLARSYPSTNSSGQRDVERTLQKPPGVTRILVLGASVVEGVGIRDLSDTITQRLENRLGSGTEVLNFGVSAYCTRAKVELLRVKGLAFDPDVVVLFVTQNDFRNFNYAAFRLGSARSRPPAVDFAYRHSAAFRALAVRLDWFEYRTDVDPEGVNHEAIGENNVVDGFRLFAELARQQGFRPIVAIWPRFTDDSVEDPAPLPGTDRLVFEELADANGIASFRFSPGFREEWRLAGGPEGARRRFTIGDRVHPNPYGARVAADILAAELPGARPVGSAREPAPAAVELARRLGGELPGASGAADQRRDVNTGNELLAQGRLDEAIAAYRAAVEAEPRLAEAHHNLGVALRSRGDLPDALREFLIAVQLEPELAEGHRNVGVTLLQLGRANDARRPLERALSLAPEDELTRRALAEALAASGTEPGPADPRPGSTR